MRKKLLTTTDTYSWTILRVALGGVMLGHGLQKVFGWFGGPGWHNTIAYFTGTVGIPAWLGAIVILIESLGALLLILGLAGRVQAALTAIVMIGAFFVAHVPNGFFMNWYGNRQGEGYEFDILYWAMAVVIMINGSGRYSIDHWLTRASFEKNAPVAFPNPAAQ